MKENPIIERKQEGTFETRGEWFDRMGRNVGKMLCIVAIILSVVAAVAHMASQKWANFALDFVVMVLPAVALACQEN